MKVSKKFRENVNTGIDIFRRSIVRSTIELCMMIDEYKSGRIVFEDKVVISSTKKKQIGDVYETKIRVADSLLYSPDDAVCGYDIYGVEFGMKGAFETSPFLSLDDLLAVYNEVYKCVLHH